MRGEYAFSLWTIWLIVELPPCARRIPNGAVSFTNQSGTTSACAENTPPDQPLHRRDRNYLRVRGEYALLGLEELLEGELPPRARRILQRDLIGAVDLGTTSACAENTVPVPTPAHHGWNYLRVRGEYHLTGLVLVGNQELPPRARRIRPRGVAGTSFGGTTSACAENTMFDAPRRLSWWNYLRVRGEYGLQYRGPLVPMELPPRARRILAQSR